MPQALNGVHRLLAYQLAHDDDNGDGDDASEWTAAISMARKELLFIILIIASQFACYFRMPFVIKVNAKKKQKRRKRPSRVYTEVENSLCVCRVHAGSRASRTLLQWGRAAASSDALQIERHILMPFSLFFRQRNNTIRWGNARNADEQTHDNTAAIHPRRTTTNRWRNSINIFFFKYEIYHRS